MPGDQPYSLQRLLDVYPSFALLAGLQLQVFDCLEGGPLSASQAAGHLGVEARRLEALLQALAAIGLLEVHEGGRFGNTADAAALLAKSSPAYLGGSHTLWAQLWEAGLRAADSIRTGQPQVRHETALMPAGQLEDFITGLHPDALEVGGLLARRPEWSACSTLVDVGGGSGGVSIALCQSHPRLRAAVVELPAVVPLTRRFVGQAGLAERIEARMADLFAHPLSGAFDAAVLKAFLQTLSPEQARVALVHVGAALVPGAWIYILGQGILDDSRRSPREAACFNLAFLSLYPEGRAYTESEHRAWLEAAGFVAVERSLLAEGSQLITARKK